MKTKTIFFILILALAVFFQSCSKDDDYNGKQTAFTLTITPPSELSDVSLSNLSVSFKELNTGKITNSTTFINNDINLTVNEGSYEITVTGKISYTIDGNTITSSVSGYKESVIITGESLSTVMALFLKTSQSDFIIEEIFFTGTRTAEGKQYLGDKYLKIYNNTDKVLYADGLIIAQSEFLTVTKQDYTPNIIANSFAASAITIIPGTGTQYPIQPGSFFIIAEDAVNHKEYNPNSIDLRNADFEFYSEDLDDVDNPAVPNMENLFSSMIIHNRGFRSFILARIPATVNKNTYLTDYVYDYEYDFVFGGVNYPMNDSAYSIPNEWIVDAVNLSVSASFQWIVTAPSLDMGWTYCGKLSADPSRYGKSVRRKTLSTTPDGIKILKDTNNSTLDFDAEVVPSLMQ